MTAGYLNRRHDCPFHGDEHCHSLTCIHDCNIEENETFMTYLEVGERLKEGDEFIPREYR